MITKLLSIGATALLFGAFMADAGRAQEARQLFGRVANASNHQATPLGGYARGCIAGAVQLPETGPTWQAMRLSRNRNWAHPEAVDFVQDLSRFAAGLNGWNGLYVGDMSQPRGGPMLTGHRSHQIGLDIDIWLRPGTDMRLSRQERENISSIRLSTSNNAYVNSNWTANHHLLLRQAALDPRVARIFIFPGAKVQMCNAEPAGSDRSWLRKIRPWWGHNYHFHVRLACPRGAGGCVNQDPPPPGDGCADAEQWVRNIVNPPPPNPNAPRATSTPRRELIMADLPGQCSALVRSR